MILYNGTPPADVIDQYELVGSARGYPIYQKKEPDMAFVTATQILKDAAELKERKSKDYQGGKWTEADYFPFGDQSYMHMIHTKYLRMRNIMEAEETNFESLEDTLIDMINYCAMYAAWLENKKLEEDLKNEPPY